MLIHSSGGRFAGSLLFYGGGLPLGLSEAPKRFPPRPELHKNVAGAWANSAEIASFAADVFVATCSSLLRLVFAGLAPGYFKCCGLKVIQKDFESGPLSWQSLFAQEGPDGRPLFLLGTKDVLTAAQKMADHDPRVAQKSKTGHVNWASQHLNRARAHESSGFGHELKTRALSVVARSRISRSGNEDQ